MLGGDVFDRIKAVVTRQDDKTLTGAEKRHAALEEIQTIGLELATWAVNFGVEICVLYLKVQAGQALTTK